MYYIPTTEEIDRQSANALESYPQLFARTERAKEIIQNRQLHYIKNPVGLWTCKSAAAARKGKLYFLQSGKCTCRDYSEEGAWSAPIINGRKFCKHVIAMDLLRECFHEILNDIIASDNSAIPALLRYDGMNIIDRPTGRAICRAKQTREYGLRFLRPLDIHFFGKWLAVQEPAPETNWIFSPAQTRQNLLFSV